MKFRYVEFPAKPDAAFPNRQSTSRPLLAILLEKNAKQIMTYALVDSGADTCIFPASIATQLGITIPNPNAYVFSGSSDVPQIAYFETVKATIWNSDAADSPLVFELYAGFCDTLEHTGIGLLGQDGFFSRFRLTFDRQGNSFTVG
jgi:hypothetical protein